MFTKKLAVSLVALTLIATQAIYADGFKDVKSTDWHFENVNKLVSIGGIKGYSDNTFRPSNIITRAEFVALLVRCLGYTPEEAEPGFHWSKGSFVVAKANGLLEDGEFNMLVDLPIKRYEMALLTARALELRKEKISADYSNYGSLIMDYKTIPDTYKDEVMKVLATGLISGYPDKTFSGDKTLTRAEATAVMSRLLEPGLRKVPAKPSAAGSITLNETKLIEDFFRSGLENLMIPVFGIDYKTVTLVDSGAYKMTEAKNGNNVVLSAAGNLGETMVMVKNGVIYDTAIGSFDVVTSRTDYVMNDKDYKKADYLAFVNPNESNLKMIVNPFKK